jgi:hypothetical protein
MAWHYSHCAFPSHEFVYGLFGVELFFIMSGFVIFMTLERSATLFDFAVSRFARLPPASSHHRSHRSRPASPLSALPQVVQLGVAL